MTGEQVLGGSPGPARPARKGPAQLRTPGAKGDRRLAWRATAQTRLAQACRGRGRNQARSTAHEPFSTSFPHSHPPPAALAHVELALQGLAVVGGEALGCLHIEVGLKAVDKSADAVARTGHAVHLEDGHLPQALGVVEGAVGGSQVVLHLQLLELCIGGKGGRGDRHGDGPSGLPPVAAARACDRLLAADR